MFTKAYYFTPKELAIKLGYTPEDKRIADAALILSNFFRDNGDSIRRARIPEQDLDFATSPMRFMLKQPTTQFYGGAQDADKLVVEKPPYIGVLMKYLEGPVVVETLE